MRANRFQTYHLIKPPLTHCPLKAKQNSGLNARMEMQRCSRNFFKHISTALFLIDALRDQTIRSMLIRPATPLPYPLWT